MIDTVNIGSTETPKEILYDVVIIGGGPAEPTAAIYTSRATLKTLVIDKGLISGRLGITSKIADYPAITDEVSGARAAG